MWVRQQEDAKGDMITLRESAAARRSCGRSMTEEVEPVAKSVMRFVVAFCCTLIWAAAIHWLWGQLT